MWQYVIIIKRFSIGIVCCLYRERKIHMDNNNNNNIFTPEDKTYEFDTADIEQNKVMALLSYIIFFIPLLACPNSSFAKFHANQSLVLTIANIIVGLLGNIPVIGRFTGILNAAITILSILGLVYAAQGKAKELPLIKALGIKIIQ